MFPTLAYLVRITNRIHLCLNLCKHSVSIGMYCHYWLERRDITLCISPKLTYLLRLLFYAHKNKIHRFTIKCYFTFLRYAQPMLVREFSLRLLLNGIWQLTSSNIVDRVLNHYPVGNVSICIDVLRHNPIRYICTRIDWLIRSPCMQHSSGDCFDINLSRPFKVLTCSSMGAKLN